MGLPIGTCRMNGGDSDWSIYKEKELRGPRVLYITLMAPNEEGLMTGYISAASTIGSKLAWYRMAWCGESRASVGVRREFQGRVQWRHWESTSWQCTPLILRSTSHCRPTHACYTCKMIVNRVNNMYTITIKMWSSITKTETKSKQTLPKMPLFTNQFAVLVAYVRHTV